MPKAKAGVVRKITRSALKKVLITGGLLGFGATTAGAISAAKERAQQPLAPPTQLPPGY